jgi:hypothetical protein
MKLKAKGIFDNNKADPNIRHKYVLDVEFETEEINEKTGKPVYVKNRELPEKDQVFVICDHILASESEQFMRVTKNGGITTDMSSIVLSKVVSLHNLEHPTEDREMTIEEVANAYKSPMARSIITDIALHLMRTSDIDEEEVKN